MLGNDYRNSAGSIVATLQDDMAAAVTNWDEAMFFQSLENLPIGERSEARQR